MNLLDWVTRDKQVRRLAKAIRDTAKDTSAPAAVRRACRKALRAADRDDEQQVRRLRRKVLDVEAPESERIEAIEDAAELLRELRGDADGQVSPGVSDRRFGGGGLPGVGMQPADG